RDDASRAPAPLGPLGEREQECDEDAREQRCTKWIELRRRRDRGLRHPPPHTDGGDADERRSNDEEPTPAGVVDQRAREDEPQATADAEYPRDHADAGTDLLRRELVHHEAERKR